MFDHVSIGVRDTAKAGKFYDAALKPLGLERLSDSPGSLGYGRKSIGLWVNAVENPVKPDMKSGLHFCFTAPTRKAVDAFHAAGLSAGGTDNGAPGPRPIYHPGYYGAFVLDPDGNNVEAVCHRAV